MDSQDNIDIEERKRKQAYLKDQILAKGYDGLRFSEYMCAIKPDGNNIDRWTFDDLMTAVLSFKKLQGNLTFQEQHLDDSTLSLLQIFDHADLNSNPNNTKLFPEVIDDMYMPSFDEGQNRNKEQKSYIKKPKKRYSKHLTVKTDEDSSKARSTSPNDSRSSFMAGGDRSLLAPLNSSTYARGATTTKHQTGITQIFITPPKSEDLQQFSMPEASSKTQLSQTAPTRQVIQTKQADPTPLTKEKKGVSISVTDPQQVDGGIFSSTFIQYTVSTDPLGWVVKRRYNDFFWLRSMLQKFYPAVVIPPIPEKKNKHSKFQMDVLRKRMYIFENFLNNCLEHEDLKAEKLVYQFLHLTDDVLFKKIKDAAEKLSRPTKIEEINSIKGYAVLDTNPDYVKYLQLINIYSDQTTPVYKKIRGICKELMTTIKQASGLALDLNKCFATLQVISNTFNKNVPPTHSIRFESTYASLCKMMSSWSDQLQKQAHLVYKNIFCFYKYSSMENEAYKEATQFKTKNDEEFAKRVRELIAKKERLFQTGDVNKWDMDAFKARDIPKEDLTRNKDQAFSVMLASETKEVRQMRDFAAYLNATTSGEIARAFDMKCYRYNSNFQDFISNQLSGFNRLQMGWDDLICAPSEVRSRSRIHLVTAKSFSQEASTVETSATNITSTSNPDSSSILKGQTSARGAK